MDFSQLRLLAVFALVVERGSFAEAARVIGSSRSRVSEQVAQLESQLGVRLLQRSTRQLNVTREGREVYTQAAKLQPVLASVEAVVSPEEPSGQVSLSVNHDIAHRFILPVLGDLRKRYPKLQLALRLDDYKSDLIGENIDLAIRIGLPRDEGLIARPLYQDSFVLMASPELLERFGVPSELEQLLNYPWVLLEQQLQGQGQIALQRDGQTLLLKPQDSYVSDSPLMMQQMVLEGLGVGALLPSTVREPLSEGKLQTLFTDQIRGEPVVFSLVYPSRRQLPLRTRAVIDFLLQCNIFNPNRE